MLKINKNQLNFLTVTVSERTTLDPAYYLLSLYSKDNHDTKVLRMTGDTSMNPNRWNIFKILEVPKEDEDLEIGWVNLNPGFQYDYTIYQTSNPTGTSINGAGIVERGLLKVNGTGSTQATFTESNNIVTFE